MSEARRLRIGYALEPKKVHSFISQSLVSHTQNQGIDLFQIDAAKPLIEQGPFDAIIHKLYGEKWKQQLNEFSSQNPSVVIIDSPVAIERLRNRISMLEVVKDLKISQENGALISIPKQVLVFDSELSDLSNFRELKFPVIAKPLVADGSATSHKMSLVFNNNGLKVLEPPVILQEFVNHGGVIFKVYVVGKFVKCVKRSSLPDISEEKLGTLGAAMSFSQISNLSSDGYRADMEEAEMPPLSFVNEVADGLRKALRLHLFNFDMIRDASTGNHCYFVIDINYFPGYAKMPSYESVLSDFFRDIVNESLRLVVVESQESDCDSGKLPS